jgi:Zn-dependent peptidase ImmA (M78 family)/DNA-binding XRE family transcriptional regulator
MIAKRIGQARKSASLSLRALADKVGVSQTTISKYEKGLATPDSVMLMKLAKAMGIKSSFFFRTSSYQLENVEYRKQNISNKALKMIDAKVLNLVERRFELEELYPPAISKRFLVPKELPMNINYLYEIEEIANELRKAWNLGEDPIADLSDILELQGIKVFMIDENVDNGFDGLTAMVNGNPIIVISKCWSGVRQQFTLAHELGHQIVRGRLGAEIDEERASNRFAGAFLLPKKALLDRLGSERKSIEIAELALLKEEFGVSMQVGFIRANQLKIISYKYSSSLRKLFKQNGWDSNEPTQSYPMERVKRFKQLVLRAVSQEVISESKGAELLDMTVRKFHNYRVTGK